MKKLLWIICFNILFVGSSFAACTAGIPCLSWNLTTNADATYTTSVGADIPVTITLTNSASDFSLSGVKVFLSAGATSGWQLTADNCTGTTVAANSSCTIVGSLAPSTEGMHTLTVQATNGTTPGEITQVFSLKADALLHIVVGHDGFGSNSTSKHANFKGVERDEAGTSILWKSLDGTTWQDSSSELSSLTPAGTFLLSSAWGDGLWVVSGFDTINETIASFTSPDGSTWTARTALALPATFADANELHVTYKNGVWLMVGSVIIGDENDDISKSFIYRSADGITWTKVTPTLSLTSIDLNSLDFEPTTNASGGIWYATGVYRQTGEDAGADKGMLLESVDNGVTWTNVSTRVNTNNGLAADEVLKELNTLKYDSANSRWLAGGNASAGDGFTETVPIILASNNNGLTWTKVTLPDTTASAEATHISAINSAHGTLVAVGVKEGSGVAADTVLVYTSTDGLTWAKRITGLPTTYHDTVITGLSWSNNMWIISGDYSAATTENIFKAFMLTSSSVNAVSWSELTGLPAPVNPNLVQLIGNIGTNN
jgi:hypothetical protein